MIADFIGVFFARLVVTVSGGTKGVFYLRSGRLVGRPGDNGLDFVLVANNSASGVDCGNLRTFRVLAGGK